MKLTIDRNKWLRGLRGSASTLLNEEGKQCCIGILCSALGVSNDHLLNVGSIAAIKNLQKIQIPHWLKENCIHGTVDVYKAYSINDNTSPSLTEKEREQNISEIFAKHDIQVEFIN